MMIRDHSCSDKPLVDQALDSSENLLDFRIADRDSEQLGLVGHQLFAFEQDSDSFRVDGPGGLECPVELVFEGLFAQQISDGDLIEGSFGRMRDIILGVDGVLLVGICD